MRVEQTNVYGQSVILKRKLGAELTSPITVNGLPTNGDPLKAGTPLDANGNVANDGTAVGLLFNDVNIGNPNGTILRAFACVSDSHVTASCGIVLSQAVKDALPLIVFDS